MGAKSAGAQPHWSVRVHAWFRYSVTLRFLQIDARPDIYAVPPLTARPCWFRYTELSENTDGVVGSKHSTLQARSLRESLLDWVSGPIYINEKFPDRLRGNGAKLCLHFFPRQFKLDTTDGELCHVAPHHLLYTTTYLPPTVRDEEESLRKSALFSILRGMHSLDGFAWNILGYVPRSSAPG